MKKIIILLFVIASFLTTSSCKKENDNGWEKSMLFGSWEQTGGSDFIACPDGTNAKIEFSDNDYTEYDTDEDGCVLETGSSSNYTFDGEMIVLVVDAKSYEITELNSNILSVNIYYDGHPAGNATYVKI